MPHCQSLICHLNAIPVTYYSKENVLEYQQPLNFNLTCLKNVKQVIKKSKNQVFLSIYQFACWDG